MAKRWWERAMINLADVSTLYGMPPAWVELAVLEQRERDELAAERAAAKTSLDHDFDGFDAFDELDRFGDDDDDEGDGGTKVPREPVAA